MRPTGKLHIGHLESVLGEWKDLQKDHESFYFVADWHAITTNPDTKHIKEHSIEMVKDWIAYGLEPERSTLFIQSKVPEHTELSNAFSMLVNLGRLERLPSFNEYLKEIVKTGSEDKKVHDQAKRAKVNHGFLGYPILQSADILIYKADVVPVGEDQLPHLELTREIARKFNSLYDNIFPVPEPKLGAKPRILGYDGRKMSKSYGNTIQPTDTGQELEKKVKRMVTDPKKVHMGDPGNPYECSVYDLQEIYNQQHPTVAKTCQTGERGCADCKKELSSKIADRYEHFKEKRTTLTDDYILDILEEGSKKAREVAVETMNEVKEAMSLDYKR